MCNNAALSGGLVYCALVELELDDVAEVHVAVAVAALSVRRLQQTLYQLWLACIPKWGRQSTQTLYRIFHVSLPRVA